MATITETYMKCPDCKYSGEEKGHPIVKFLKHYVVYKCRACGHRFKIFGSITAAGVCSLLKLVEALPSLKHPGGKGCR